MYFDLAEFGQRIKKLRDMKDLSQEALARKVGISHEHLNRIEKGKNGPSLDLIIELSCFFEVSIDYLVTGRDFRSMMAKKRLQAVKEELDAIIHDIE